MLFAKSAYLSKKILNHTLLREVYTPPQSVYVALTTTNPTRLGDMSGEVSGGGYERLILNFSVAADGAETSFVKNIYDLNWAQATAAWGTVAYSAVMDDETGGNMLYFAELVDSEGNPAPQQILLGNFFKFPAEAIELEEG